MLFGLNVFAKVSFALPGDETASLIRQPWTEICRKKNAWLANKQPITGIKRCEDVS